MSARGLCMDSEIHTDRGSIFMQASLYATGQGKENVETIHLLPGKESVGTTHILLLENAVLLTFHDYAA